AGYSADRRGRLLRATKPPGWLRRERQRGRGTPLPLHERSLAPQSNVQASANRPDVMPNAWSDMFITPVPAFVFTASQAVMTCAFGCSGNVLPGGPGSADAGAAATATDSPTAAAAAIRRRFMAILLGPVCP